MTQAHFHVCQVPIFSYQLFRVCCLFSLAFIGCTHSSSLFLDNANAKTEQKRESFDKVSGRVLQSLIEKNWDKLRQDAAPDVVLAQYYRLYSSGWSKQKRSDIFPDMIFGPDIEEASTEEAPVEIYSLAATKIHSSKPISKKQREWFKKFCQYVRSTNSNRPDWIVRGEFIEADDTDILHGPAIKGKVLSNEHWYVEFTFYKNCWVVSRLIIQGH